MKIDPLLILKHKKIKAFYLNTFNWLLVFETDERLFAFEACGDCCSSSWLEHVSGIDALLGNEIFNSESVDVKSLDLAEFDCLDSYSFKFQTMKGWTDMEFRHEHNGYYGAFIEFKEGVMKWEDLEPVEFKEQYVFRKITEDF